jgi:hypothetical protein
MSEDQYYEYNKIKDILNNNLGIKCTFPCFTSEQHGSLVRCMLELHDPSYKNIPISQMTEDVLCRVICRQSINDTNNSSENMEIVS